MPHAPQFMSSFCVLTHAVPHIIPTTQEHIESRHPNPGMHA
jgi:hypothetical protein